MDSETASDGPRPRAAVLSWSGGKDSALALRECRRMGWEVSALLTTVTEPYARITMHGVRESLLTAQASAIGLPLEVVRIPAQCTNAVYEERMGAAVRRLVDDGADAFVFGDLFLEDIRAYREEQLDRIGARALFPLWGKDTSALARAFLADGFRAVVVTVDPRKLEASFAGRGYDAAFLADLPSGVDPCGENGEFHTFVYAGPVLRKPVSIRRGEVVQRDGFVFADLLPGNSP